MLSERVGALFTDADDLHSAEAIAKMASGQPLTDEDRFPWLERVGRRLAAGLSEGRSTVVACSALRRLYRDRLRAAAGSPVFFVHLAGDRNTLALRLRDRPDHFMPASLLDSQLAVLEGLGDDEAGTTISIGADPASIICRIEAAMSDSRTTKERL